VQPAEWLTIQGTVSSVAVDLVEIETADGEIIPFEGRPLSFAQEQGFSPDEGDAVTLSGFDEDGEFKIGQIALDGGISITLRRRRWPTGLGWPRSRGMSEQAT